MTNKQKRRLSRITGRDTRVIKAYLGIIERYEPELLVGKRKNRVDAGHLDKLTLRATRGSASRTFVPHDFKARFPNISVNEFQECRDTAIAMWQSYLERGGSKPMRSRGYSSRKIPRFAFAQRFEFLYTPELSIRHWLSIRNSLDSVREGRHTHEKLTIPLSPASYHLTRLREGDLKTVRIFKDSRRKWWAIFTVTLDTKSPQSAGRPPAVLAIDLGIKKTACSVLLTQEGYKHVRYWRYKGKSELMTTYDERISSLQEKREELLKMGIDSSGVGKKLRKLGRRRSNLSKDFDRKLVKDIVYHALQLTESYDLYVAIGRLRGIRFLARKGNHQGTGFRKMIHRWSFARMREYLRHKLAVLGIEENRFSAINEGWTSIRCHKCGRKGIRPSQNLFICHTCGYRANADLNGAINIGRRLIMLIPSLKNEKGLGMWLFPQEKTTPKASRSKRSKGKSSLAKRLPISLESESVADCYDQISLEMFVSSEDPAMGKTVEESFASRKLGSFGVKQGKEARCQGRSHVPMNLDEAHVTSTDFCQKKAGDSSRENGRTQKFPAIGFHSPCGNGSC
ncbi:MAG: RNA-guided endonuclease InsQ/TnpB family protein [Candidatus Thorarchaeota archaeon]|jgi:IS605 OrfB family transposase